MAANTYQVTEAMASDILPLRGDMAATLDFIPADGFLFEFTIDEPGSYVISSSGAPIRGFDGVKHPTFLISGAIGIYVRFAYDKTAQCWKPIESNMVGSGTGGSGSTGGTGGAGVTPVFTAVATTLPAGSQATAVVSGPAESPLLTLGIPRGDKGAAGSGSGGTGTFTPEVLITQQSNGDVIFDKASSGTNNYQVMLVRNGKFLNPVGYEPGEDINVTVRMGPLGPFTMDWDLNWAHPDRQVPVLAKEPGSINKITAHLVGAIDANNPGGWETDVYPKGSTIGYGVPSFMSRNATSGVSYYFMRSPSGTGAMTEMRAGQTLKILRNALGTEAYGAIGATNGPGIYLITGVQGNGNRAELRTGPGVRSAFDRGVLAFGGSGITATVQDLIISGAREQAISPGSACGINMSDGSTALTVKNVKLYDNENGILTGNVGNANPADDFTGSVTLIDCELDKNGVGLPGYTHNIYIGHSTGNFKALRTSFTNCVAAHDIKSRMAYTELKQVLAKGAKAGRELNLPIGGKLLAENCTFWKIDGSTQGNLVGIGEETVDAARPREYIFRNCRFQNDYGTVNDGKDCTFVANFDTVPMQFIDCEFIGPATAAIQGTHQDYPGLTTVNGIRYNPAYPPVFTFTGGPIGPVLPVGYVPIPVTPIAG